jgi:hypothetical protein
MSDLFNDLYQLELYIKRKIEAFENSNKCTVASIDYKSYLFDASEDSLCPTLGRTVSVSIKRKIS